VCRVTFSVPPYSSSRDPVIYCAAVHITITQQRDGTVLRPNCRQRVPVQYSTIQCSAEALQEAHTFSTNMPGGGMCSCPPCTNTVPVRDMLGLPALAARLLCPFDCTPFTTKIPVGMEAETLTVGSAVHARMVTFYHSTDVMTRHMSETWRYGNMGLV
jgi:hypothetical protein